MPTSEKLNGKYECGFPMIGCVCDKQYTNKYVTGFLHFLIYNLMRYCSFLVVNHKSWRVEHRRRWTWTFKCEYKTLNVRLNGNKCALENNGYGKHLFWMQLKKRYVKILFSYRWAFLIAQRLYKRTPYTEPKARWQKCALAAQLELNWVFSATNDRIVFTCFTQCGQISSLFSTKSKSTLLSTNDDEHEWIWNMNSNWLPLYTQCSLLHRTLRYRLKMLDASIAIFFVRIEQKL